MTVEDKQWAKRGALYIRNAGRDVALQPGTSGQLLGTQGDEQYPAWRDIVVPVTLIATFGVAVGGQLGIAYDEFGGVPKVCRFSLPFDVTPYRKARLGVYASGDEANAGVNKGVEVVNVADDSLIAKVEWEEAGAQQKLGSWNTLALSAAIVCKVMAKCSSATEALTIYTAVL